VAEPHKKLVRQTSLRVTTILESVAEEIGEIMRIPRLIMAIVIVSHLWSPDALFASTPLKNQRGKVVKIYLVNETIEKDSPQENLLNLVAVSRRVDTAAPARGALNALIAGPTAAEKNRGFRSPYAENLSVKHLVIRNGLARMSLRSTSRLGRWPGDNAPWRFSEAITRTLKQFPTVKRVAICLDRETLGDKDGNPKRCR
jgi:Sporulation and spore germination